MVSVIIPTYNRRHLLEKALDSVFAQTYRNIEIIVVDDGSTDDTRCYVNGSILENKNVLLEYHYQPNRGPSAARNFGVSRAKGEYIKFLDSDDSLSERDVEEFLVSIKENNADLCIGSRRYMSPEGKTWNVNYTPSVGVISDALEKFYKLELRPQGALWFYRAELCREYPWNEKLLAREDTEFLTRILIDNKTVCGAPGAIYNQRYHPYGRQMERQFDESVLVDIVISNEDLCDLMLKRNVSRTARQAFAGSLCRTVLRLWDVDRTVAKRLYMIAKKAYPHPELNLSNNYSRLTRILARSAWLLGGPQMSAVLWRYYQRRQA